MYKIIDKKEELLCTINKLLANKEYYDYWTEIYNGENYIYVLKYPGYSDSIVICKYSYPDEGLRIGFMKSGEECFSYETYTNTIDIKDTIKFIDYIKYYIEYKKQKNYTKSLDEKIDFVNNLIKNISS